MTWDNNSQATPSTLTKTEAIERIKKDAVAAGYTGGFKVLYNGVEVVTPDNLPEAVDYSKVKIASKMNNAVKARKAVKKAVKKIMKKACK